MEVEKTELYIKRLEIIKDLRTFKKGFSIDFDVPITILVGENGTGKSTLLDLIRTEYAPEAGVSVWRPMNLEGYAKITGIKPKKEQAYYFDFHSSDTKYLGIFGDDMESQLNTMTASSGIGVVGQIHSTGMLRSQNSLLLLDEFARGFSPKLQKHFAKGLYLSTLQYKNQVIVSTHSEYLMGYEAMPECKLYSVEHKKYMSYEEFMNQHLNTKK